MDAADRDTLDRFLQDIDSMRVHRDAEGRASLKKPLLLLLVLSRLESGKLSQNRIHFTDVEAELSALIKKFGRRGGKGSASPEEPFVYMGTARFWNIHYPEGTDNNRRTRRSKRVLRDPATHATLDATLFTLLNSSPEAREIARKHIEGRWWAGADGLPVIPM